MSARRVLQLERSVVMIDLGGVLDTGKRTVIESALRQGASVMEEEREVQRA